MNTDTDSSITHVPIHNDGDVALNKQPSSSSSTASSRSMLKWGAIIFAFIVLAGICTIVGITMSKKSNNIPLKSISPAAASVAGMDVQDTCTPDPAVQNLDFYIAHDSTQLQDIWTSSNKEYRFTVVCKTSTPPGKIDIFARDADTRSGYYWNVPSACNWNESTNRYEINFRLTSGSLSLGEYHIYIQAGDSQIPTTDYTYAAALANCYTGLFKIGEYEWTHSKDADGNAIFGQCQDPPDGHCNTFQIKEAEQECQEKETKTAVESIHCPGIKPLIINCTTRIGCGSGETCTTDNTCSPYAWVEVGDDYDCEFAPDAQCSDYKTRPAEYVCQYVSGEQVSDYFCTEDRPTDTVICSEQLTCECERRPNHTGCDNFLYREIAPDLLEECDIKIGGCLEDEFCNTGIRDIQMYNGVVTSSDLGRCEYDQSRSNSASIATVIMSVFMVFVAVCVM